MLILVDRACQGGEQEGKEETSTKKWRSENRGRETVEEKEEIGRIRWMMTKQKKRREEENEQCK